MRAALVYSFLVFVNISQSLGAQTMLVFSADKRPGAVIFTDECLPRGLTNSMTVADLRTWATNVIEHYNQRPDFRTVSLSKKDIPKAIETIQTSIPSCKHSYPIAPFVYDVIAPDSNHPTVDLGRDSSGHIESISISWYDYGAIIGRESFVPKWENEPWYSRKLADGIYLWHGYD